MKPSDLFALLVILLTWVFQDKSFALSTPRYLALATASRVSPCSVYMLLGGENVTWLCVYLAFAGVELYIPSDFPFLEDV